MKRTVSGATDSSGGSNRDGCYPVAAQRTAHGLPAGPGRYADPVTLCPDVQHSTVGDVDLAYNTMGAGDDPPVVLVAGLGAQLIMWDDGFCQELVDRGLYVVRFDNRDVGLSSHLGDGPTVDALTAGDGAPAYGLADMAADTASLIENLGLGSAHIVGASLGGMIAQVLAIEHPERVRSLTSIMSTTGDAQVGQASEAAFAMLFLPPVASREEAMDRAILINRTVGSPAYPTDAPELRERAAAAFDRAFDPAGVARQLAAAHAAADRTDALRRLEVAALVIHGADDPLIAVSGGVATAEAIPDAELVVIDGMGHDLPRSLWSTIAGRIADLVERAEQESTTKISAR
jgi:pimeloyl-ACP methyl ester carboxylesterase